MRITTTEKKSTKKQGPIQKRFNRLHEQLERQKRLNQQFEKDLDELTLTYRHLSQEANYKQLETLKALAQKLITFAGRKSLSDWHREEIDEWMEDLLMHRIAPVDEETAKELHQQYAESILQCIGTTREELEAQINETIFEEHEKAANGSPEDFFQDDLFRFDDLDEENWFEEDEAGIHQQTDAFQEQDLPAQLMDRDWIKTLFRRAAQNLHPDRESNPEKRKLKEQQLSELLAARKENDILTMLKIYGEATDTQQLEFAEKEMNQICDMLEDQLEELKLQQESSIYSSPERHMVYGLLYRKNSKKRQQALKQWQQELTEESDRNHHLVTYLRNLNNLKQILTNRRDQRREFMEWMLDEVIF
jgi:hypothetical protein